MNCSLFGSRQLIFIVLGLILLVSPIRYPPTSRYCRWWGILYSSARNRCLAFW